MRLIALAAASLLSACASTYVANPNDPVDMAAELGNRGRQYVGMGETCDMAAGGGHRLAVERSLQSEQQRLGVLAGLVDRAYAGRASDELNGHMQTQMRTHGLTAAQFCDEVVAQAQTDMNTRATFILAMTGDLDALSMARDISRQPYIDTPSFNPGEGFLAWVQ
jgi:hypothetical protein